MRQIKIKTPRRPQRPLLVRLLALFGVFTLGFIACYLWGFWLLVMALQRACDNGMFICS